MKNRSITCFLRTRTIGYDYIYSTICVVTRFLKMIDEVKAKPSYLV